MAAWLQKLSQAITVPCTSLALVVYIFNNSLYLYTNNGN